MPELPEVETVRRTLAPDIVGRRVVGARLLRRDVLVVPGDPAGGFSRRRGAPTPRRATRAHLLDGCEIVEILRRGKQLVIVGRGESGEFRGLGVHLGMSGHLAFLKGSSRMTPGPGKADRHVHAVLRFEHGRLVFADPRRFGGLRSFGTMDELREALAELGPDGLEVSAEDMTRVTSGSERVIKAVLLDQSCIAGVGNIYADEALFRARISPLRRAGTLSAEDTRVLAASVREVLSAALEHGGSTLRDYADARGRPGEYQDRHLVYGRGGEGCAACGEVLMSARIAQRTSVYCRLCQV